MVFTFGFFGRRSPKERELERKTAEAVDAIRSVAADAADAVATATVTVAAERRRLVEAARVATGNHLRDTVLGVNEPPSGRGAT